MLSSGKHRGDASIIACRTSLNPDRPSCRVQSTIRTHQAHGIWCPGVWDKELHSLPRSTTWGSSRCRDSSDGHPYVMCWVDFQQCATGKRRSWRWGPRGMTLIVRNVVADRHACTLTRLHGKFSGTAGSEVALQSVLLLSIGHLFAASTTVPIFELSIGSPEVRTQTVRT